MGIIKEAAKDAFNKSFGTIHISFLFCWGFVL